MKVQLNETTELPPNGGEGPQAVACPRLLDLDPDPEEALDAERRWIGAWVASLTLADDDVRWAHDAWESIASRTYPPTGDRFHVVTLAQRLGQHDHNYRVRVAVESGGAVMLVQVKAERDTAVVVSAGAGAGAGATPSSSSSKIEARPDRTTWLRSGYGQRGELSEGPRWAEVYAALRRQWDVEEEVLSGSGVDEVNANQ